ncbi:hypothetical protein RB598_008324 [Gaeumannomyces tritici]
MEQTLQTFLRPFFSLPLSYPDLAWRISQVKPHLPSSTITSCRDKPQIATVTADSLPTSTAFDSLASVGPSCSRGFRPNAAVSLGGLIAPPTRLLPPKTTLSEFAPCINQAASEPPLERWPNAARPSPVSSRHPLILAGELVQHSVRSAHHRPRTESHRPRPRVTTNMSTQVDLSTIPISPDGDNGPSSSSVDKEITVFHDQNNFNVKHPLMHNWTLWFTKPPSGKGDNNWNDLLKEVITFNSVEEFWGIYNNIAPVSELALKSDYHLFKEGVRPEWEDSQNKHGGKWSYSFKDKRSIGIDELWLHTMLAAIGETLEGEDDGEVMGVVVNVRKAFYRVGVWTRSTGKSIPGRGEGDVAGGKGRAPEKSKGILMDIGKRFKEVLKLPPNEIIEFSGHNDAAHSGSTRAKAKFTV